MNNPATLEAAPPCLGQVSLSFDGQLDGWCYYPSRPAERATVEVLVNGAIARAVVAAQLRPDLRALGMGDGYCGFLLALPPAAIQEDGPRVIEVRERRRKHLIGRLVAGAEHGQTPEQARLNVLVASLARMHRNLDILVANKPVPLATWFGHLGVALQAHAPSRPWNAVLAASQDILNVVPHTNLRQFSNPHVTFIVSASPNIQDTAARLREAALSLHPTEAEFILLYSRTRPTAALLPTRLRYLHLIQTDNYCSLASALNEAVLQARGKWLGFVASDHLVPAGLAHACRAANPSTLYAPDTLLTHLQTHPAIIIGPPTTPPPYGGLSCLLSRDSFQTLGGLDASFTERTMWMNFFEKAACTESIQPWPQHRHFLPARNV